MFLVSVMMIFTSGIHAQTEEYVYDREEFLREAYSEGKKEVQLAQHVKRSVNNPEIQAYADSLEGDHSKANDELMRLARRNRWEVPAEMLEKHVQELNRLSNVTGELLEKQYLTAMIQGHQQVIDKFRAAMLSARDIELRTWIGNQIPVLQRHLNKAQELLQEIDSKKHRH